MSAWRKLRAAVVIGAVSAGFWAAVTGAVLAVVLTVKGQWATVPLPGVFYLPLAAGATIGFVGGVLYSLSLAGVARDREVGVRQGAALGGLVGALIFLGVLTALEGSLRFLNLFSMSTLVPTAIFATLGAATGAGILAAASRGKLPAGRHPPPRLKGDE